jgi:signal transduction histidine kinase
MRLFAGTTRRDWAMVAVVVVAATVQVSIGGPVRPAPAADLLGDVCALAGALALAWVRPRPLVAGSASLGLTGVGVLLTGPIVPLAGWLAVLLVTRHAPDLAVALRAAAAGGAWLATALVAAAVVYRQPDALAVVLALTLVVVLAASVLRLQRARVDSQQRERLAERERTVAAERLRIARDLHDLVGHGLSLVAVQSGAARLALDAGDVDEARRAVAAIEAASRGALGEMRQMLGVLRAGTDDAADGAGRTGAQPGLADVDTLVEQARTGGHAVTVQRSGPLNEVPAAAGLCAYRVVQEALTNVVRHAPGAAVTITLATGDALTVEVVDERVDGASPPDPDRPHFGLLGLAERVGAAGGTLEAGPRGDGVGWRVTATVPLSGSAPGEESA